MLLVNKYVEHRGEAKMCCFLAAFLGGGFLLKSWRSWRCRLQRRGLAALAAALAVAGAFAVWHLPHYLSRAEANDRALLTEILAEPICRAGTADR
jgi:hypothetical protein